MASYTPRPTLMAEFYQPIKEIEIEMTLKDGEAMKVVFVDPDKIKRLLEDNDFLRGMAENLNKETKGGEKNRWKI